jgi:hypothetical protein
MRIRLMGTRDETDRAVAALRTALQVREVSDWYSNRGNSIIGRVYLDVEPAATATAPELST